MSGAMKLAGRTTRVGTSPTMKVTATVDRLRREGVDVIDFGAGEPDFPTPDATKAAAHAAIDANFTRYTPVAGIADLKRAICDRYKADYGVAYTEAQVIVTAGGKQALYNAVALRSATNDHARAVLADADRTGETRRRDAGARADYAEDGFAVPRSHSGCRRRARRHHHQLAGQPAARSSPSPSCAIGGPREAGHLGRRHHATSPALRPVPQTSAGAGDVPRAGRPVRVGLEGLRDDRLALRLAN